MVMKVEHRRAAAAALAFLSCGYATLRASWTPWSWVVVSLCVHAGFFLCRWPPGRTLDVWTQRTTMWSLLSTLSFAHFLVQDSTFTGWSSVYHFCSGPASMATGGELFEDGPAAVSAFAYCTSAYRWNLNGWRKALSIWNFVLSSALGVQHLVIEIGLGGLLPGEDAIPRECFVSVIWRLVPFFLNKWEADFGAECSSILFELPHFATELLVILPSVQLVATRLRVLARPPMFRGPDALRARWGPDILQAQWRTDQGHTGFWSRLRKNLRPLTLVCGVTFVAALNALQVPLFLEQTAISSAQSAEYMKYRGTLASLHTGQMSLMQGMGGSRPKSTSIRGEYLSKDLLGILSNTTLYACAASVDGMGCVSDAQEEMVAWMVERDIMVSLTGSLKAVRDSHKSPSLALNVTLLTAHPQWTFHALEFRELQERDSAVEMLQHVLFGRAFYGTEVDTPGSFISMQRSYVEKAVRGRSAAREGAQVMDGDGGFTDGAETGSEAEAPLVTRNPLIAFFSRPPPTDASRFLLLVEKHTIELERMASDDHRSLVPLVELALAIMRLSCEKWFSLVAMYVSYVVFRDPPPHAREYIKVVAVASRVFQHCILMSFPAVCWAYGAGFMFSMFASAVFWTNPIIRLVEHMKKVAMEVQPLHWHPVTLDEVERMGGNCAICWGTIGNHGDRNGEGTATVERPAGDGTVAEDSVMGLACGHAYHASCLLEWLHSCFGQSRKATCPMCQSQVPLKVKYKLRNMLSFGTAVEGEEGGPARHHLGAIPPAQRAYPGLATLAQALPNEFVGRWGIDFVVEGGEQMMNGGDQGDQRFVREEDGGHDLDFGGGETGADIQAGAQVDPQTSDESLRETDSADALIISGDLADSGTSASSIHLPRYHPGSHGTASLTFTFSSDDDDEDYEFDEDDDEDHEFDGDEEEENVDGEEVLNGLLEAFDETDHPYVGRLRPRRSRHV